MRFAAAALLFCLAATPAWACRSAISVRPEPSPIPVSAPFSVLLTFCDLGNRLPEQVAVDATMPAHRHGMNYRPVVTKVAPGNFRIDGLLFHMPGEWEFVFDVTYADARRERLTHTVRVQ